MIIRNRKTFTTPAVDTLPIGTVQSFVGSIPPMGYLLLDGRQVSKTRYLELWNLCGDAFAYGQTAANGMFFIPNMMGQTIVGYDSAQTEFNAIGKKFGSKSHNLTIAELAAHTHVQNEHRHPLVSNYDDANYNTGTIPADGVGFSLPWDSGTIIRTQQTSFATATNQNTGSGTAHNNIQPSVAFNYIVKAEMITSVVTSNIYDGLDSDSSTKALSANQGKILKTMISSGNGILRGIFPILGGQGIKTITGTSGAVTGLGSQYGFKEGILTKHPLVAGFTRKYICVGTVNNNFNGTSYVRMGGQIILQFGIWGSADLNAYWYTTHRDCTSAINAMANGHLVMDGYNSVGSSTTVLGNILIEVYDIPNV